MCNMAVQDTATWIFIKEAIQLLCKRHEDRRVNAHWGFIEWGKTGKGYVWTVCDGVSIGYGRHCTIRVEGRDDFPPITVYGHSGPSEGYTEVDLTDPKWTLETFADLLAIKCQLEG